MGQNVRICSSVTILGSSHLTIGANTWIGHGTLIVASADLTIGSDVNIAPLCFIGTGTHEIDLEGPSIAGIGKSLPITIGDGTWVCAHSTLIAGVTIGKKSIIAAGSVVTRDVPSGELWGGVPAIRIRSLI